jgi:hypothetical protein
MRLRNHSAIQLDGDRLALQIKVPHELREERPVGNRAFGSVDNDLHGWPIAERGWLMIRHRQSAIRNRHGIIAATSE